jgi:site-specific DNA-methyltransferase (adenine-specific)
MTDSFKYYVPMDSYSTPKDLYDKLDLEFHFNFDPCPLDHDLSKWNGLLCDWGSSNFVNPPYRRKLKELFIKKAVAESRKGKICVLLLPVSTSTKIFHEWILPNAKDIRFIKGRLKFSGLKDNFKKDNMIIIL